ncbi:PadR family transcriptional regulator [Streptomyces sp. NPDC003247]|uniref:PadR family transcriptional regulator n=1 Tax=Streptomyces sp. NPDC003247 TaxID=3364677 RepID=UPI0036B072E4
MSLRVALLGMLAAGGPSSGYDLAKRFDGSLSHVWSARQSQIYPELSKLVDDRLATVTDDGPRGRKIYELTEAGRAGLEDWLTGTEPRQRIRSESNLRMFLLPLLDSPTAVRLLRRESALYAGQVRELEDIRGTLPEPHEERRNGWYALDLGVRQMAAIRDWAAATADRIEAIAAAGADTGSQPAPGDEG